MPARRRIRASLALLIVGLITTGPGCSSKPAEVDTAIVSPDSAVKPAPAPTAPETATPAPISPPAPEAKP